MCIVVNMTVALKTVPICAEVRATLITRNTGYFNQQQHVKYTVLHVHHSYHVRLKSYHNVMIIATLCFRH